MAPLRASWQELLRTRSGAASTDLDFVGRKEKRAVCNNSQNLSASLSLNNRVTSARLPLGNHVEAKEPGVQVLHESRQAPSEVLTKHGTNHQVLAELVHVSGEPQKLNRRNPGFDSNDGRVGPPVGCPARRSQQAMTIHTGNDDRSARNQQQSKPPLVAKPVLTLHWLLKTANPFWTTSEFKAAKKKLNMIGIENYTDIEAALKVKGFLNNRLRDNGLKAFAPATLDRLRSIVHSEQERQRQATILQLQRSLREQRRIEQESKVTQGLRPKMIRAFGLTQKAECKESSNDDWYDTESTGDEGQGYSSIESSAPQSPLGIRPCPPVFCIATPRPG